MTRERNAARVRATNETIMSVCRIIKVIPLEDAQEVLDELTRMDSIMPILSPALYRAEMEAIDDWREVINKFIALQKALEAVT